MTDKTEAVFFTFTEPCRAGFLNIIEARQFKQDGKGKGDPRYDGTFMLTPDSKDLVALKALVGPMLQALHPGKKIVGRRLTQEELDGGNTFEVNVPWKDGTRAADKAKNAKPPKDQEFFRNHIIIKAASKYAPALSAVEGGKFTEYTDLATRPALTRLFYSGAWFVPHVQLHSYPARDDKPGGVGLWLPALMFAKHDKRLGGSGVNAAEVFKGYAGKVSAEDPTGGAGELDDEIPF